jgi:hypothetical protein
MAAAHDDRPTRSLSGRALKADASQVLLNGRAVSVGQDGGIALVAQ